MNDTAGDGRPGLSPTGTKIQHRVSPKSDDGREADPSEIDPFDDDDSATLRTVRDADSTVRYEGGSAALEEAIAQMEEGDQSLIDPDVTNKLPRPIVHVGEPVSKGEKLDELLATVDKIRGEMAPKLPPNIAESALEVMTAERTRPDAEATQEVREGDIQEERAQEILAKVDGARENPPAVDGTQKLEDGDIEEVIAVSHGLDESEAEGTKVVGVGTLFALVCFVSVVAAVMGSGVTLLLLSQADLRALVFGPDTSSSAPSDTALGGIVSHVAGVHCDAGSCRADEAAASAFDGAGAQVAIAPVVAEQQTEEEGDSGAEAPDGAVPSESAEPEEPAAEEPEEPAAEEPEEPAAEEPEEPVAEEPEEPAPGSVASQQPPPEGVPQHYILPIVFVPERQRIESYDRDVLRRLAKAMAAQRGTRYEIVAYTFDEEMDDRDRAERLSVRRAAKALDLIRSFGPSKTRFDIRGAAPNETLPQAPGKTPDRLHGAVLFRVLP